MLNQLGSDADNLAVAWWTSQFTAATVMALSVHLLQAANGAWL